MNPSRLIPNPSLNSTARGARRTLAAVLSACCAFAGGVGLTGLSSIATQVLAQAPAPKAIVIRDTASNTLGFRVEMEKTTYAVNEPIRFAVRAEKPFFLYIYNTDAAGKSTLIYPNKKEGSAQLAARTRHPVPSKIEFAADQAGTENLVMIASTTRMEVGQLKSESDFYVASETELVGAMEAKGIVIRDQTTEATAQPGETVVRTTALKITPASARTSARPAPPAERPPQTEPAPVTNPAAATFVTTDRVNYKLGQAMSITFGATQAGYVHLFVVYPDGTSERVLTRAVQANVPQVLDAQADSPSGRQMLLAAFSKTRNLDDGFISTATSEDAARSEKGVRIVSPRPPAPAAPEVPYTTRSIRVAD